MQWALRKINDFIERKGLTSLECFDLIDTNSNGVIDEKEFTKGLVQLGLQGMTGTQIVSVFWALDKNKSGDLSIGEWLYYIDGRKGEERPLDKGLEKQLLEEIDELFDSLTEKKVSYITEKSLQQAFKAAGVPMSRQDCRTIV